jgi:hypothetical protein
MNRNQSGDAMDLDVLSRAGIEHGGKSAAPNGAPLDATFVISRLEEAGRTLLALPGTGWSTKLRSTQLEMVRSALEGYGWGTRPVRPAVPSAARITRMDEALAWIQLIKKERSYVLRRIVVARALVHPVSDRYLFSWRRLAATVGADHKAVQRWHAQGINLIVAALNAGVIDPQKSFAR